MLIIMHVLGGAVAVAVAAGAYHIFPDFVTGLWWIGAVAIGLAVVFILESWAIILDSRIASMRERVAYASAAFIVLAALGSITIKSSGDRIGFLDTFWYGGWLLCLAGFLLWLWVLMAALIARDRRNRIQHF